MEYQPLSVVRIKDIDRVGVVVKHSGTVNNMIVINYYLGSGQRCLRYTFSSNLEPVQLFNFNDDIPF